MVGPTHGIFAHAPHHCLDRFGVLAQRLPHGFWLRAHFFAPHLVHGGVGQRDDMKAVIADLGLRQTFGYAFGIGRAHVHADMLDVVGDAAMGHQFLLEGGHRFVATAWRHQQQPPRFQVVHHSDVVMSLLEAGFIDADHPYTRHLVALAGDAHIVLDAPPQPLRAHPQLVRRLRHRQGLAQRQSQRFEQQSKTAARACPWHLGLRGLAAGAAINTRHFGVQPCLKLEKIQMPPATLDAVMDALPIHATGWTRQFIGIALHLEINPPLDRVQVNVGHDPWRLQTQRGGKQSFDGNTHQGTLDSKKGLSDMIPDVNFHTKRHRASEKGIDIAEKIHEADAIDFRFGLMLRMMLTFGLRRKEVVHNRPWKADRGDKLSIYPGDAKGGRPRDILFDTPEQRIVLDYVKSHVNKNESLGWTTNSRGEKATLQFNIGKYNRLMAKIGITKLKDGATGHGLRAQYAENSALIAGMIPATLGGTKGQMDKESLDVTRAQISEQLGHSRIDVTASYYGSFGRHAKPDEVDRCKTNIEKGLRATATMQLKPVPPERMVDCLQMIGELDAIDVGATPKQIHFLWQAHSARFASEWVSLQAGNAEAIEVQALKLTSGGAQAAA